MTFIDNKRWLLRRSTTPNVTPVAPGLNVTSPIFPDETWADNAIMDGELFANTADKKLWLKCDEETPVLIASINGTTEFVDLTDTPSGYGGSGNKLVKVKADETGLDYFDFVPLNEFTQLIDTPNTYEGFDGYAVVVNSNETGLEYKAINQNLNGLNDTEITDYTNGKILRANGSKFIDVNAKDYLVTLINDQEISGKKEFVDEATFNSIIINQPLTFNGQSENTSINNITTDIALGSATNNELATSLAIKTYVDAQLFSGGGVTSSFVTLNTNQTISGNKIFNGTVTFNSTVEFSTLNIGTLTVTEDTFNSITSYQYIGAENLDGSYRMFINLNGELQIERRETGIWQFRATL